MNGRVWVGARPTPVQYATVLFVGVIGVMIAGLQPLLLGAMAVAGRIDAHQIGQAATAELLMMGIAGGLAGAFIKPHRLPLIAAIACLALALANFATMGSSGDSFTLLRAAAGIPSGILVWVTICMIARAPMPEQWSGIFLTVQTLAQFLCAILLSTTIVVTWGADGGFAFLAGLSVFGAATAIFLPRSFADLVPDDGDAVSGLPPLRGWFSLASCFLYLAFVVAVWVYSEPLSRQSGHAPEIVGYAISVSLAFQVLGGLAATLLAGRVGWFAVLSGCAVINALILAAFYVLPGEATYLALAALFGFLWLFSLPFLVPMTIDADPSRRAAVLLGGVQLIGGSLGPFIAAELVTDTDARGAIVFGAVCLAGSIAIAAVLRLRRARLVSATRI
jgi:hypothetical protein